IARIDRAGVVVVAVEGRPRRADPALAGLGAVADVAVGAAASARRVRMLAPGDRVAAVERAAVVVVAVERRPGDARSGLTYLGAVADVVVGAGDAVRHRRVLTAGRGVTGVGRARVTVVAVGGAARPADARL